MKKILVVDDEEPLREILEGLLTQGGYQVSCAPDGMSAWHRLSKEEFSTVLTDLKMPGIDGLNLLARIKKIYPSCPVIIITAFGTIDIAVKAMKKGAFDFICKPFDRQELLQAVKKACSTAEAEKEEPRLSEEEKPRLAMIGSSPAMAEIYSIIRQVAPTNSRVLITGESGTGKELVASAIHWLSRRKNKPFVKINCAAIPETLLESELFGYERGAFTGAISDKPGKFEIAHGGTIFLDEVSEMSAGMQAKLLRVLEGKEFERVGSSKTIKVDIRVIAATNTKLEQKIADGKFREDLYFRLNVVSIHLKPLRERKEDIPELLDFFIKKFCKENKKTLIVFSEPAQVLLKTYNWPGNIRELENFIERVVVLSKKKLLEPEDIVAFLPGINSFLPSSKSEAGLLKPLKAISKLAEKGMILATIEKYKGNRTKAAQFLGISRRSLQMKLKNL